MSRYRSSRVLRANIPEIRIPGGHNLPALLSWSYDNLELQEPVIQLVHLESKKIESALTLYETRRRVETAMIAISTRRKQAKYHAYAAPSLAHSNSCGLHEMPVRRGENLGKTCKHKFSKVTYGFTTYILQKIYVSSNGRNLRSNFKYMYL